MKLDQDQLAAATAPVTEGLQILAPAGSGKTTTLVARAQWLLRYAEPSDVVALTFTVSAAAELTERMPDRVRCATLHAWAFEILDRIRHLQGRTVYDPIEAQAIRAEAMRATKSSRTVDDVYHQWLREAHATDYDLLLADLLTEIRAEPARITLPRFVLVDETQDLDETQHQILEALRVRGVVVTEVGDPKQSIYRWRNARPDLWHLANVRELHANYRSRPSIVGAANRHAPLQDGGAAYPVMLATRQQGDVLPVRYVALEGTPGPIDLAAQFGARTAGQGTRAVLCRTWSLARRARAALEYSTMADATPSHYVSAQPVRWYGSTESSWDTSMAQTLARWIRLAHPTARHDLNLLALVADELTKHVWTALYRPTPARVAFRKVAGSSALVAAADAGILPPMPDTTSSAEVAGALIQFLGTQTVTRHAHPRHAAAMERQLPQLDHPARRSVTAFRWWWALGRDNAVEYDADPVPVHVMTVHQAKGLEFDHVLYLPSRPLDTVDPEELSIHHVAISRARETLWIGTP